MVVAQKFVIALAQSGDVSFVLLSWGHQQEGGNFVVIGVKLAYLKKMRYWWLQMTVAKN